VRNPGKPNVNRPRYWLNLLAFALAAVALALAVGVMRLAHDAAVGYVHPSRTDSRAGTPGSLGVSYQDVTLITVDGLRLAAWYTPSQNGALILAAHGYGGHRSAEMHALFARHQYGVVSWDFRAHGESEGDTVTFGYLERMDVEAALDMALALEAAHVGAWGASMGGASVIHAASQRPEIEAVVADSSFPALEDELTRAITVPAFRPLVRYFAERETGLSGDQVRPVDWIGQIAPRPVFLIQGTADAAIPPDSAQRLFDAAGEPKVLWLQPGAGHVGAYSAAREEYEQRVIEFFKAALLDQEPGIDASP
jgi:fermentation-respiration switch protein FrsA (DUF1100 family)